MSAFGDVEDVIDVFRMGAIDYLRKPVDPDREIWARALCAWEKAWMKARQRDLEIRLDRWAWALGESAEGVADAFTTIVLEEMTKVRDCMGEFAGQLNDRYMLNVDRDETDPIVGTFLRMQGAVGSVLQRTADLRNAGTARVAQYDTVDLKDLLMMAVVKLSPALIFRHVKLDISAQCQTRIATFSEDVRMILEEMLFGSIDAYRVIDRDDIPTIRSQRNVNVTVTHDEGRHMIVVSVTDQAPPMPDDVCTQIRLGRQVPRGHERGWALSLVQRMARNIGGCIEVAPLIDKGNRVSLFIPVADHASASHSR
jgi:signal transduction histidine kinase